MSLGYWIARFFEWLDYREALAERRAQWRRVQGKAARRAWPRRTLL